MSDDTQQGRTFAKVALDLLDGIEWRVRGMYISGVDTRFIVWGRGTQGNYPDNLASADAAR